MASVIRDGKLQQLDTFLFYKCHLLSNNPIKNLSVWVSRTGDGYLYFAIALLILWAGTPHGESFFYTALAAFAIEVPIYISLKNLVKRNRPFNKLQAFQSHIAPSDKFSMPSGHTAAAFVFASIVATYYPEFAVLAYCWASLIGLARVLLGVHFPGDILAGGLLGYGCAQAAFVLLAI
ncbi:phosphatase PAP2 family protein [Psychrosphaera sp. B3R10]|uniref:phosphatase PAP2 family protein n=1 Tax=unclassified Psychrosphaera TaxID=2641570 RepID=UPI001C0A0447|nr:MULTISPECIES: phosphatase PAP2 family protein [unclassified Psychrosphaera]MBU2882578.1 phosphatase PAP2 family protein [Psychrosphaera sp. I2R16]MBU2989403.1 phosphatase PAP2 family protein [Psychrosphaera sp. B3R10]MDO6718237.1 phosphatase PAP2 family protein [Psychrosphaera sp. 1_MG-2023]